MRKRRRFLNPKMLFKLGNDLALTVLMLVAMAYFLTGNTIHELVGVVILVLFIVHNILNRRWYLTTFKGKHKLRRILQNVVNLLFLVTMVLMMVSGILISSDIFPFISVDHDLIFYQLHAQTAYWGFFIMAVHVGFSWEMIISSVRKMTGITGTSRIRTIVFRILAVLIVFYGVHASFDRGMGSKLTVYNPFGSWHEDSAFSFLIDYLSIMGIYICGTHYALKFIRKQEKRAVKKI